MLEVLDNYIMCSAKAVVEKHLMSMVVKVVWQ